MLSKSHFHLFPCASEPDILGGDFLAGATGSWWFWWLSLKLEPGTLGAEAEVLIGFRSWWGWRFVGRENLSPEMSLFSGMVNVLLVGWAEMFNLFLNSFGGSEAARTSLGLSLPVIRSQLVVQGYRRDFREQKVYLIQGFVREGRVITLLFQC